MKIIDAGYYIYPEVDSFGMIKRIEEVARVCYKSEDKITEGSAKKMVNALVKNKHWAMLEHGYAVIEADKVGYTAFTEVLKVVRKHEGEVPRIKYSPKGYSGRAIISGNMRAWLELLELCRVYYIPISRDLVQILKQEKYSPVFDDVNAPTTNRGTYKELEPSELNNKERLIHKYISVKFIVDRGVSHEIVRHRDSSFAQESTRYCNYGKAGDVVFIRPCYFDEGTLEMENWEESCRASERDYLYLTLVRGKTPQEARGVLHTSLKTEVVMSATPKCWIHFGELRADGVTGAPHPQIKEVAVPLMEELKGMDPVGFEKV